MARRTLALLFALGLGLRLAGLGLWGTFDTEVQKAWAARAATAGVADIYGPSDAEVVARGGGGLRGALALDVPPTWFTWGTARYFVDYPPGSILVLAAAGRAWAAVAPDLPNRRGFNVAINVAPLLGSLAIAILLRRTAPRPLGDRRALLSWLNPALLLAAPVLGYQDTVFGALALGAVLALMGSHPGRAAALTVAAGLAKPQGALLLPALLVVLAREGGWRRAIPAGALVAAVILAPWWGAGHLLSAIHGALRPLGQTTLAPLGYNVWWIAGWAMDVARGEGLPLARVVEIREFAAWAGFDPRGPARGALLFATAGIAAWLWGRLRAGDRTALPLAVILEVHAYALLGTSVHENHTLLAVILSPLLVGAGPGAGPVVAGTSGFALANLGLASGLGRRVTRLRDVEALRAAPGVDLSILVACAHVGLVALIVGAARRRALAGKIAPA